MIACLGNPPFSGTASFSTMARTTQKARKSTGGKAASIQLPHPPAQVPSVKLLLQPPNLPGRDEQNLHQVSVFFVTPLPSLTSSPRVIAIYVLMGDICTYAIFACVSCVPTISTSLLELKLKRQPSSALLATCQNAKLPLRTM